jgi:hypothetical protein
VIAVILQAVAGAVHGGGILVWATLFLFRGRLSHVPVEVMVRLYRAWGPVQGLSLGVWVFSQLYRFPGIANPGLPFPDSYLLGWGNWVNNLTTMRAALFGLLWVSYLVLEVWTLEPCRLLDKDGVIQDPSTYLATVQRITRQLVFNALLVIAIVSLSALGARP